MTIQQLIQGYDRRAREEEQMIEDHKYNSSEDALSFERVTIKASLYREFANEFRGLLPVEPKHEDEECRGCGSEKNLSGEDEFCDDCFMNDPNQD